MSYTGSEGRYSARRMQKSATGLALLAIASLAAGCGGGSDDDRNPDAVRDEPLEHIHGVDAQSDGTVLVATHEGLFRSPPGSTGLSRVGEREKDLMGFAVVTDDRFVASGHPDRRDDLPPQLGLMESTDGGETWRNVSLLGEADLHVLRVDGDRVYAFDGLQSRLLVSNDGGATWDSRGATPSIFDLAVDPRDRNRIVAATERGLYESTTAGRRWRRVNPRMSGFLAWPDGDALFLLDARGAVHRGDGSLRSWRAAGAIGGQPVAFGATSDGLLAATSRGSVMSSADEGHTWKLRARP